MLEGVPNFALCVGYTNASWTLSADLSSLFVTRLLESHADVTATTLWYPPATPTVLDPKPLLDFNSGYVLRAIAGPAQAGLDQALVHPPELHP